MENENNINQENEVVVDAKEVKDDYVMAPLPESEKIEENKREPNSKPFWSMRIAGGLIDIFLLFLLTFGLYQLFIMTPMGNPLRANFDKVYEVSEHYKLKPLLEGSDETMAYMVYQDETEYAVVSQDHRVYHDHDLNLDYVIVDYESSTDELVAAYREAVPKDAIYKKATFDYDLINYAITMLAGGISELVLFFIIPLTNKRRASLGKLFAGTQLINSKYQVRAKWFQLLGRYLFIFLIETAVPVLFLGSFGSYMFKGYVYGYYVFTFAFFIVPIVSYLISFTNKRRKSLHDLVSFTMIIDKKTFLPIDEQ